MKLQKQLEREANQRLKEEKRAEKERINAEKRQQKEQEKLIKRTLQETRKNAKPKECVKVCIQCHHLTQDSCDHYLCDNQFVGILG